MRLFITNPIFKREEFAELLNSNGIKAYAVSNGVMFDEAALLNKPSYKLPHWIFINRGAMLGE